MGLDTTPAGVAGDHEGFQAGNRACHDAMIELDLHPNARQSVVEGGVRTPQCRPEMMNPKNGEGDNPGKALRWGETWLRCGKDRSTHGNRNAKAETTKAFS